VMLPIIIAFSLAAVLMLTGTLLSARRIDHRVQTITHLTSHIDHNLNSIQLAARTGRIAGRIWVAAKPLSGELDQVIGAGKGIQRSADSILTTAGSINARALAIEATAGSINRNVRAIHANARSIDGTVGSLDGTVHAINRNALSIGNSVGSINTSVASIDGSASRIVGIFGLVLRSADQADPRVAGINIRVRALQVLVRPLKRSLDEVLNQVGEGSGADGHVVRRGPDRGRKSLHGHANGIDCFVNAQNQAGSYCGK